MPSTINASSSGSGGLISTGDASGVLQLQNNGTVALTLSGGSNATIGDFTNSSLGTFNGFLQVGANLQLMSFSNGTTNTQTQLASNTYYSGAYKAIAGGAGASKLFIGGAGTFEFAGSNVLTNAGDAITFVPTLACGSLGQTVALQGASSVVGIGITFPASASVSTNPNTLDDYEEGTWTPTAPVGLSVSTAVYQKVGNTVYINAFIDVGSNSNPAPLVIGGLPYALASGSSSVGCFNNDGLDLYAYLDSTGINIRNNINNTRTCSDTSGNFVAFQMSYITTA